MPFFTEKRAFNSVRFPFFLLHKAYSLAKKYRRLLRKAYSRAKNYRRARNLSSMRGEIKQLYRTRLVNLIDVNQPLVLISQVQRSGGTLLSQLFDGHPECLVHPHELHIGHPRKWNWPALDMAAHPGSWFKTLVETPSAHFFVDGYRKQSRGGANHPEKFPFLFLPNLQREIFKSCVACKPLRNQREILNCYLTSYFNAWLDYQGIYYPKKFVVAFTARLSMIPESIDGFFRDYPDGKLISIIREPKNWWVSAHAHSTKGYGSWHGEAAEIWKASARAMLRNKQQYGTRVYLMSYDNLVCNTVDCMKSLAQFLGIEFRDNLLMPTFQGMPIIANSSFEVVQHGVIKEPLVRAQSVLSHSERKAIDSETSDLYTQVLTEIDIQESAGHLRKNNEWDSASDFGD